MYIPKNMEMKEDEAIADFIAHHGFGLIISSNLEATHLPLFYQVDTSGQRVIYGHFARANEHWRTLENERVLVIFNGPHAYISPTWYDTQPAVPTWNYVAVHCYGHVALLEEAETITSMNALIEKYEPSLLINHPLMPEDYQHRLRQAVVGFKIVVDTIQAKEKLGQHRKTDDQQGVYLALKKSTHSDAQTLCTYMENRGIGIG